MRILLANATTGHLAECTDAAPIEHCVDRRAGGKTDAAPVYAFPVSEGTAVQGLGHAAATGTSRPRDHGPWRGTTAVLENAYLCVAEYGGDVEAPGALDVHEEASEAQRSHARSGKLG